MTSASAKPLPEVKCFSSSQARERVSPTRPCVKNKPGRWASRSNGRSIASASPTGPVFSCSLLRRSRIISAATVRRNAWERCRNAPTHREPWRARAALTDRYDPEVLPGDYGQGGGRPPHDEVLTTAQLARRLSIPEASVTRLVRLGEIPYIPGIANGYRFLWSHVVAALGELERRHPRRGE